MLGAIYHVGYTTANIEEAIEYFRTTFGGEVFARSPETRANKLAYVRAGGSEIELIEPADKSALAGRPGLVLDHVGYFVANLETAMAELKAKGVEFATEAPTINLVGKRMIYLTPDSARGTRIHLTER